jgi:hydrogenase expression/formation protein HypE
LTDDSIVLLAHGAGGRKSADLIRDVFLRHFANPALDLLGDSAILSVPAVRLAFTTDAFVVSPLFFPGADIGKLAVCGTVNDLACSGATPLALSAAFILEEGLDLAVLERIVASMHDAAAEVGVSIVAGDTKVVPRGSADQVFITTSGVGLIADGLTPPSPNRAAPGDVVLLTGPIADHGMAVMTAREGLRLGTEIRSDCAPLAGLASALLAAAPDVHVLRDPTRGGLAAVLNEIAAQSGVCIEIDEAAVPVNEGVRVACELLGIDPLHVANEGKLVAIVPPDQAEAALAALRSHRYGADAAVIGRVQDGPSGRVHLKTVLGSLRLLDLPSGDLLPRIC